MPEMRFSFDGNPVQNPKDWAMSEEVIRRVKEFGTMGLVKEWKLPATFSGTGYTYLHDLFHASGVCVVVDVLIEYRCTSLDSWQDLFIGKLFINDCKFNLSKCEVITQIEDNSVTAKLINNQSIKVRLNGDTSKNGVAITPATVIDNFLMFTPSTGAYGLRCIAYRVYDVLSYLIEHLSDTEVAFASSAFEPGGIYEDYVITTGYALRNQTLAADVTTEDVPYVTLKDAITNIEKKFSTGFWVDDSGATPEFKVEVRSDIYGTSNTLTINNVPNITERFKTDEMYSSVNIGSEKTIEDDGCTYTFPNGPFVTHSEENYGVLGDCNIDATIDLVSTWIIDSNVIEDILINGNDEYDKEIILIQGRAPGQNVARDTKVIPGGVPAYYNDALLNENVLPRHLGSIPNTIEQFLGFSDLTFLADPAADFTSNFLCPGGIPSSPWDFDSEVSDPSNSFNSAHRYTCKRSGIYNFTLKFDVTLTSMCAISGALGALINHYNACGTLINTYSAGVATSLIPPLNTVTLVTGSFPANAGDYMESNISLGGLGGGVTNYTIESSSFFQCTSAPNADYQSYDPDDYKVILYDFEFPLSFSNWELIRAAITESITINPGTDPANNIKGNIQELTYNLGRGVVKGTLIKSVN